MASEGLAPTTREVIARRVREERTARGWSQQELARRLEEQTGKSVARIVVSRIEATGEDRERRNIAVDDLNALALALGVAPVMLQTLRDDEAPIRVIGESGPVFPSGDWRRMLRSGLPMSVPEKTAVALVQGRADQIAEATTDEIPMIALAMIHDLENMLRAWHTGHSRHTAEEPAPVPMADFDTTGKG
ncbi:MAG: hypothetical protein QOI06_495 [Nocardioidaceae bacterium]|jgi:transcriptional regulator with XRE-family HTH domain|nr:hypothetical protein [Nocardioidaceae bacterium]